MAFIIMALACSFVVVWALQCCMHSVRVSVCDYTHKQQYHTHSSSTFGAATAAVVVLVGIFGLQSSFDCFSLCH